LKFIDSYHYINSSLAEQVEVLGKENWDKFIITKSHFSDHKDKWHLIFRKGVYPYSFMNDFSKFDETSLPPIEAFTSDLPLRPISEEDYNVAQEVWKAFDCKTLRDYHNLYVTLDTCLLADCYQDFRWSTLSSFRIDPAQYVALPGIAFDAAMCATLSGTGSQHWLGIFRENSSIPLKSIDSYGMGIEFYDKDFREFSKGRRH